jgi:membrane-associated protein
MDSLSQLADLFLHLDVHLEHWGGVLGPWLYLVLFTIVFCETGLVVTPFLPGDSLLFAVGALIGAGTLPLNLPLVLGLLLVAAITGDAVNYAVGYYLGPKVFKYERSWLFNVKHLERAQSFYERYGGKAIVLARFIPIIRTFAPFVAGIGKMTYWRFSMYNVVGAVVWVTSFLVGGYLLGERLKDYFHVVVLAIIAVSLLPVAYEFFVSLRRKPEPAAVAARSE